MPEFCPAADYSNADVNNNGYIDLYDVWIARSGMTLPSTYDTDINNDGVPDEVDLLIVKAKAIEAIITAAPRKRKVILTTWGSIKKINIISTGQYPVKLKLTNPKTTYCETKKESKMKTVTFMITILGKVVI